MKNNFFSHNYIKIFMIFAGLLIAISLSFIISSYIKEDENLTSEREVNVFNCNHYGKVVVVVDNNGKWFFTKDGTKRIEVDENLYSDGKLAINYNKETLKVAVGRRAWENCSKNYRETVWDKAKFNGVAFRATGNEPGWVLEYTKGSKNNLKIKTMTTEDIYTVVDIVNDQEKLTSTMKIRGSDMIIKLFAGKCQDTMADDTYP
ncbi:MAG: hypothetical protein JJV96_00930, partial [Alphaproteobacteria bacterium]|nr:hypothetical protein [Alphaproteobacteria bacterium]